MKVTGWHFPTLLVVVFAMVAARSEPAHATAARVAALRGHFAFSDETDVFRFPSAAPSYGDRIGFDFTRSADQGSAGVLWGRTLTLGLYLNQPPLFNDIAELDAIYAGLEAPVMHRLFDAVVAWQVDERNAIGVALGSSFGIDTQDVDQFGDGRGRLSTGSRALAVDLGLGWSRADETRSNDLSLALTFHSFEQQDQGETFAKSAGLPSVTLRDRLIWNRGEARALGVEALVTRRSYDIHQPGPNIDGTYSRILGQVDVGPRFVLRERVTLATALRLRLERIAGKVGDEDGPSTFAFAFPGAVVGLEARLFDRFRLRAGADYLFQYVQTEDGEGGLGDPTQVRTTEAAYSWSLGVGFADAGFEVDAMLASALVMDGPDFVGGTAPGLFATLSGVYRWE